MGSCVALFGVPVPYLTFWLLFWGSSALQGLANECFSLQYWMSQNLRMDILWYHKNHMNSRSPLLKIPYARRTGSKKILQNFKMFKVQLYLIYFSVKGQIISAGFFFLFILQGSPIGLKFGKIRTNCGKIRKKCGKNCTKIVKKLLKKLWKNCEKNCKRSNITLRCPLRA